MTIEKRIPLCAGLGGPSTDAAAVIVALAELWGIDRTDPALDDIARGIGADVPFFLHASPAFYVGGGDVLATEYPALPATPVVLVKRARQVFRQLKPIDVLTRPRCLGQARRDSFCLACR